jgi:PAS domain S-box-containing protein
VGTAEVKQGVAMLFRRLVSAKKTEATVSNLVGDLRNEKLKSDIILNSINDGVLLVDADMIVQLFNPGAGDITGWPPAEAVGIDVTQILKLVSEKGEARDIREHPIKLAFLTKKPLRDNTAILLSRSGKQVPLTVSVSPLLNTKGEPYGAVAIFRDVTQERLEEKQRAEFISTASHEMRTPVAAIEGYLQLALNEKVSKIDPKARDFLVKALDSTHHLGQLFQDLLTSAKAEDGRLVSHPTVVELGAYVEQLADSFKFSAEKKGLFTEFIFGKSSADPGGQIGDKLVKPLYYVHVDPDRLREVITNLFDNAVKYTPAGKISVGLTGNNEVVQLFVRDTGPGIAPEDVPHLFQKFYRVDNSATRTIGGTGLGLFICRKIIELYHGRIWVESSVGQGSTFYINLPRVTAVRAEELSKQEAQSNTPKPITSLTTPV